MSKERAIVIKFGGSAATNEDGANREYLLNFFAALGKDFTKRFAHAAFVIGGGPRVRRLQAQVETQAEKDVVGMQALREHAAQMNEVIRESGFSTEIHVPHDVKSATDLFCRQEEFAITLGGLQIGQSTDTVGVTAAELFAMRGLEAQIVILSNVWRMFTADPRVDESARPIKESNVTTLVQEGVLLDDPGKFRSGMNVTIDPVATSRLQAQKTEAPAVFFGHAEDFESIQRFLRGKKPENGTLLHPSITETIYYTR